MNKHLHRIVFNRHRGQLMAVAEHVAGQGKSPGCTDAPASHAPGIVATLRPLCFALLLALGMVGQPSAQAQIVADPAAPRNQQPTILNSANGTPVVNIQTPSAAGVSRNTYSQFDVNAQGAILNNARTNAQTHLGGWVQGNPWLATGTARVILNEVNGSQPSQLRGYVEVAGDRAQVVIANPAGITCDGCGFLNADRVTMTTGTPVMNSGSLDGFRVQGGAIHVTGAGMDASRTDYTDIIARATQVNAGIWATQLRVTTGANHVSADHAQVAATPAAGSAPGYALDVGALGGMYAGKIALMGTEHGLGVRNAGHIGAQAGELVVTVDGRLENTGTLQARTDSRIAAAGGIANGGTVSAGRELVVSTPQDMDNRGGTLNAMRVEVNAASLANRGGAIEQSGVQALALNAGALSNRDGGRIGIAQTSGNEGADGAGGSGSATPDGSANAGAGGTSGNGASTDSGNAASPVTPLADGVLNIAGKLDNDGGSISAGGGIDLTSSTGLDNDGGRLGLHNLTLNGGDLANRSGELAIGGAATVNAGSIVNDGGKLSVGGTLDMASQRLSNRGGAVNVGETLSATVAKELDNAGGAIVANGSLTLQVGSVVNRDNGVVASTAGNVDLRAEGLVGNVGGTIQAAKDVSVAGNGLVNADGAIVGTNVRIDTRQQALDNTRGTIGATEGALNVHSGAVNNDTGLMQATGALNVDSSGQALTNTNAGQTGGIISGGTMTLATGDFDNRAGVVRAGTDLSARTATLDNTNGGQFGGAANVALNAATLRNTDGVVQAGENLSATLTGTADNAAGLISAGSDLAIDAQTIVNRNTISADPTKPLGIQATTVALAASRIDNNGGAVVGDAGVQITGAGTGNALDNTSGSVSSAGSLEITVEQLTNSDGTLLSGQSQSITADAMTGDGRVLSQGDLSIAVQQALDNRGEITANGRAEVTTGSTLTNRGTMQAGDLVVRAANVDNMAAGQISGERTHVTADGTVTNRGLIDGSETRIDAATLDNVGTGRVYGDHLSIQADTVNNREETVDGAKSAATIAARERLDIGARTLVNQEQALIFSAGGAEDALNIGGALDADGHATGRADLVRNASATIESLGGLALSTTTLHNTNAHFAIERVQVGGPTQSLLIQPKDNPNQYDSSQFTWEDWSHAGRYRGNTDADPAIAGAEVTAWTQYEITTTEYEDQVTQSAPAMIRAGGSMRLEGDDLVNDNSQIIAGGTLSGSLDKLQNTETFGEHLVHKEGTSQYTYSQWRGGLKRYHERKWDPKVSYTPADQVNSIRLAAGVALEHANGGGSGYAVGTRSTGDVGEAINGAKGPGTASREVQEVPVASAPEVIRTIGVNTDVPASSLFHLSPSAGNYLVETDPRFADYRQWLSSDYMLQQLGYDPAAMQKRLGDGFYEQKLVREQIGQLTGRRFLDGYASDEAQYQALLSNGATFAREWNLRPGVALSAEQMAQLTTDIVWLVERSVTMPDGSVTTALVPQVYVRAKPGDLKGDGTLIAGNVVDLELKSDLVNSGTIAGRTAVQLSGENLRNIGGRITGDSVALRARTDVDNIGGTIDASSALSVMAGRDLNVITTTHSDAKASGLSDFSRTNIDRVAGLYVTNPGGTLLAMAGRDANLTGAQIVNSGKDGQTVVAAGRDLNLGTVQVGVQENNVRNASNYLKQGGTQEIGTTIQTAGDVSLSAQRDLNARAAQVTSDQGAVAASAGRDVNLTAGENTSNWSEGRLHKRSGLMGSSSTTTRDSLSQTTAQATTLSGNTVTVQAGRDINVVGSNVVSDAGTVLVAKNDVNVLAAQNTATESHFKETKKSGLLYNGGAAITIGSQQQSVDARGTSTTAAASTVGATQGDVTIVAGNHYQQTGSHVLAPEGNIDILAKKVDIVEARETAHSVEESKFRQSGLTVAVTAPVISALQTAQQMSKAASQTSDSRMQVLAGAATALSAKNAADAYQASPDTGGGIGISITVGGSRSDSRTTTHSDTAAGSTVAAGGDVRIRAVGAGEDSDLTIRGSKVSAGGNIGLKADDEVRLLAAQNMSDMDRKSSSASGGVGVAVQFGQNGAALGITANASGSRGRGEGTDVTWTNTHVAAGKTLVIESGGDTTLRGAVAGGERVIADVGGDLNIESLQDIHDYRSKDQSVGVSGTFGFGFSVSGNFGQQKIDSDYASVTEKSGIKAGDGGFQVKVNGNTDLKGGVIASTDKAIEDGLNRLTTGTLTYSDIENHASYKASSINVGGGYSQGGGGMRCVAGACANGGGVGTDQQGRAATGGDKVPGTDLPSAGGFSAATPMAMSASGNSHSTTRSGVSGAVVTITDEAGQAARTGQTVEEALAGLNREITTGADGANSLIPIFNEKKIKAGFEIVGALQREAGTFINNRAKEADDLKKARDKESDPVRRAELDQQYQEAAKWGPGGSYRQVATALMAAAGGNVTGSTANFATAGLVNYVQQQGAGLIGDLVAKGDLKEGSPEHAALHAIVACAGAAAASQSCGAGAMGAATASLVTNLFADDGAPSQSEKEARSNLVGTLVAGMAAVANLDGVATATNAATAAADNNWLAHSEIVALNKAKWDCMSKGGAQACGQQKELEALSKKRDDQLAACEGNSSANCNQLRQDVRNAYAEILRKEDLYPALDYGLEAAHTQAQANGTLSKLDRTLGQIKGFKDSLVDGVKGTMELALSLAENQALADAAYAGDNAAYARLRAKADGIWETAKALSDPQVIANLTVTQRENLARAYESGDAAEIGRQQGEVVGFLAGLPGGGGLGVVKKVSKSEDIAAAAKAAKHASVINKGPAFKDFNQARNAALEWLENRGFRADKTKPGKFGENADNPVGMQSADEKSGFRVEFDQRHGAHINVWSGKQKETFIFEGNQAMVDQIVKQFVKEFP